MISVPDSQAVFFEPNIPHTGGLRKGGPPGGSLAPSFKFKVQTNVLHAMKSHQTLPVGRPSLRISYKTRQCGKKKHHSRCGCSPLRLIPRKDPSRNRGFRPLHILRCKYSCQEEEFTDQPQKYQHPPPGRRRASQGFRA